MITTIAELGINHSGYLASAIELIDLAKKSGVNAVKFQIKTVELCTPRSEWDRPKETPWGTVEPYIEYRRKLELSDADYAEINAHCRSISMPWSASVWDRSSLERLSRFNPPWVKLPSAHLTNDELIRACTDSGSPIVLSTGMSTEAEMDHAVSLIRDVPGAMLMHCHSAYPAPDHEQVLSLIPAMHARYGLPVGFSSHSVSPFVPLAAVSRYGAVAVECHLTKSRALKGSDHAASLELKGMELLVREICRLDTLHGDGVKRVWPSELAARQRLRGG